MSGIHKFQVSVAPQTRVPLNVNKSVVSEVTVIFVSIKPGHSLSLILNIQYVIFSQIFFEGHGEAQWIDFESHSSAILSGICCKCININSIKFNNVTVSTREYLYSKIGYFGDKQIWFL